MLVQFSVRPQSGPYVNESETPNGKFTDRGGWTDRSDVLSACVEGSWERVMALIGGYHQHVANSHPHVVTTIIVVEDGHDQPIGLKERIPASQPQPAPADQFTRRIPVHVN